MHSIERSPQEDALLVLFNSAISNLVREFPTSDNGTHVEGFQVLFRYNFALSRDIADLFQSFQASSVILDPAANPSLFQSTLVLIIKVCSCWKSQSTTPANLHFLSSTGRCWIWPARDRQRVSASTCDLVLLLFYSLHRFSLKLQVSMNFYITSRPHFCSHYSQKFVHTEQGSNFISKLHAGCLDIIPWPVIESSRFYTLYSTLKRRLDSQKITHHSAGEFLHTLKVLMAKLKVDNHTLSIGCWQLCW